MRQTDGVAFQCVRVVARFEPSNFMFVQTGSTRGKCHGVHRAVDTDNIAFQYLPLNGSWSLGQFLTRDDRP